jgi:hypothetical protein
MSAASYGTLCFLPGMIAGIDESQLPEGGVVGAGAVLRGGRAGTLIVRIIGHQVATVHVGRQLRMRRRILKIPDIIMSNTAADMNANFYFFGARAFTIQKLRTISTAFPR